MEHSVEPKSVWKHYNGIEYTVLFLTNTEHFHPEYPPTVVYKGSNGNIWSRPLTKWHGSMTFVRNKKVRNLLCLLWYRWEYYSMFPVVRRKCKSCTKCECLVSSSWKKDNDGSK